MSSSKGVKLLVAGAALFLLAGVVSTPRVALSSANDYAALLVVAALVSVIWGVKILKDNKEKRMKENRKRR
ncbi:MAG: hypothetical protein ABEK59_12605 [Halobacteria archaeon]